MSESRRGCQGLARGCKRQFAHSDECRKRIMEEILKDGDVDGRVVNATRKMIANKDVVDDELKTRMVEDSKRRKRGKGQENCR